MSQQDEEKLARKMMQQVTPRIVHAMRSVPPSGQLQAQFYTQYDAAVQFHVAAELPIGNMYRKVSKENLERYKKHINAEVVEMNNVIDRMLAKYEAEGVPVVGTTYTIEDQADLLAEMVDITYSILGLGVVFGLPYDTAFGLIHFANMMKVKDGPVMDSEGKIVKPEGWQPADLLPLLMNAYAEGKAAEEQAQQMARTAVAGAANEPAAESTPAKPH